MWKEWLLGILEKETSQEMSEIGHDPEGEMSEVSLKRWLKWAAAAVGICVVAVSVLALVSSVRNRKEAAILEVDSGVVLEFYLNRNGRILKARGSAEAVLDDHGLEDGVEKILQGYLEHGELDEDGAVIFTLRPSETGISADLGRFASEIHVYAEAFLRKKHSNGTVYVRVLEGEEISGEMAEEYGVSLGKAALVRNLIAENQSLREKDLDRLLGMSVDELSAEIAVRRYDTSFIVVVAKRVYALMVEEEIEETEETGAVPAPETEPEETKETVKATGAETAPVPESSAREVVKESETETDAESESAEETVDREAVTESAEDESVAAEADGQGEASETTAHETMVPDAEASETTASETTGPEVTVPETTAPEAAIPETMAQEIGVPENGGAIQSEATTVPAEAPTAAETEAPAPPETESVPTPPQTGSIIEQVVPLTPVG